MRNDVQRLLAASDIFVNASHREGLPVAVLEAMAAGLPVVATNVGELPLVIVKGTGIVVPPKQPDAMAQAVCALLENPEQRRAYGLAAQAHVTRHYSLTHWIEQHLVLYNDLGRSPTKPAHNDS